jgi:hypothetical protein
MALTENLTLGTKFHEMLERFNGLGLIHTPRRVGKNSLLSTPYIWSGAHEPVGSVTGRMSWTIKPLKRNDDRAVWIACNVPGHAKARRSRIEHILQISETMDVLVSVHDRKPFYREIEHRQQGGRHGKQFIQVKMLGDGGTQTCLEEDVDVFPSEGLHARVALAAECGGIRKAPDTLANLQGDINKMQQNIYDHMMKLPNPEAPFDGD